MASLNAATRITAVTPSDTTVLGATAVFVGGAGNIAIQTQQGSTAVTITGVLAGTLLPINAYRVMLTNTTATNIVALY